MLSKGPIEEEEYLLLFKEDTIKYLKYKSNGDENNHIKIYCNKDIYNIEDYSIYISCNIKTIFDSDKYHCCFIGCEFIVKIDYPLLRCCMLESFLAILDIPNSPYFWYRDSKHLLKQIRHDLVTVYRLIMNHKKFIPGCK